MSSISQCDTFCVGKISAVQSVLKSMVKWKIPNFSRFCSVACKNYICSAALTSAVTNCGHLYQIYLYPNGYDEKYQEYLSLMLVNNFNHEVEYRFIILNHKNKISEQSSILKTKVDLNSRISECSNFIKRCRIMDKTEGLLIDDELTIYCEIITNIENNDLQNTELLSKQLDYSDRFEALDDFENLLNNEKFSDVIFIVGGKSLHAHKTILASRSPVFAAMFEHNMKENIDNKVEINEINYEVFKEVLRFIYSAKVRDIEKIATDLLAAADVYNLQGLKTMCSECLSKCVSVDNAIEYLSIADLYNVDILKNQVKDFIVTNAKAMVEKPEFEKIGNLHTYLIVEIFRALVLQAKS